MAGESDDVQSSTAAAALSVSPTRYPVHPSLRPRPREPRTCRLAFVPQSTHSKLRYRRLSRLYFLPVFFAGSVPASACCLTVRTPAHAQSLPPSQALWFGFCLQEASTDTMLRQFVSARAVALGQSARLPPLRALASSATGGGSTPLEQHNRGKPEAGSPAENTPREVSLRGKQARRGDVVVGR